MIPVEHEDVDELKKWGMGLAFIKEHCALCKAPTRWWHKKTNTPCCLSCAKTRSVSDLMTAQAKKED